jgi:DNA-binding MarR family transcriptional regulator
MSLEAPTRLDELLNYRLARILAKSSAPGIRLFEGMYGVSRREWRLVGLVAIYGAMSPSALATLAHLDRPCVSRAITELVAKGLLTRAGLPNDRRRAQVDITRKGKKLYEVVFPQVARINNSVLSVLSADQLTQLDTILDLLTQSAEEVARSSPVLEKASRHLGGLRLMPELN